MFFDYFPPKFLKELAICNVELILVTFIYNLLTYLIPLVRIRLGSAIIILIITNLIILGLKFTHFSINHR
ncbi:hypothetical protein [Limosilactobacillus viscerum]|uniref:hypothetical protein n=1 Tax=Limosilactobacillus viscerum TaxID=2993450 RepID=UPI0024BAA2E0|nr:hypothetical protein [Limosilactobacillus viscerum]